VICNLKKCVLTLSGTSLLRLTHKTTASGC
jgi:hypothetical protein